MDRPSFEYEQFWGKGAGLSLSDWISRAPQDWQVLQMSIAPNHGQWGPVDGFPLEVPPNLGWRRWFGWQVQGLHCYAFRASFARYITRSFYRNGKWQLLTGPFLRDEQGRVALGQLAAQGTESFLFLRAVTYSALFAPITFAPPHEKNIGAEHTHAGLRLAPELCSRAMLLERWRAWLPLHTMAREKRERAKARGAQTVLRNHTLLGSRMMLRMALSANQGGDTELTEACGVHEQGWRFREDANKELIRALNSSLAGGRLRLRANGPLRGRRMYGRRSRKLGD